MSKSLEGVTIVHPAYLGPRWTSDTTGGLTVWDEYAGKQRALAHAQQLGATLRPLDCAADITDELLADPSVFTLSGIRAATHQSMQDLLASGQTHGIHIPKHKPYVECDESELHSFPYVVGWCEGTDGGVGKYLIENAEQAGTLRAAIESTLDADTEGPNLSLREYIPTPSDHFTSYRILSGPTGAILGAGLLYSRHTKGAGKRIIDHPQAHRQAYANKSPGADLRLLLETPTSPYFLNSRDVRSNLQQGGSCIPLYGDNRRTLTPVEEEILSEHGIDLLSPEVPQDIQRQMRTLGSLVLRHHDLATGADFIQHRDTNRYHLLEINDGPGLQTFGECWHAGEPLSDIDLEAELLIMALDSLAIERQQ